MINKIGPSIIKAIYKPKSSSHKGDNGRLLIIGGSEKYHGAPLLAAKTASKIVDLVYFSSTQENNEFIKKMKSKLCEFIAAPRNEIIHITKLADAVLIGPGLGISQENQNLINRLFKEFPDQKFILDADALKMIKPNQLNKNCLITPHRLEFKTLFNLTANKLNVQNAAKKYLCVIVLKGNVDYLADGRKKGAVDFKINLTGNAGMTKGGTGDVLAGLIAALACKNDLFLSACAGVFINGLAGDILKKRASYYYSASDLVQEIPKTIKRCEDL